MGISSDCAEMRFDWQKAEKEARERAERAEAERRAREHAVNEHYEKLKANDITVPLQSE